jgi:hypothetical protein
VNTSHTLLLAREKRWRVKLKRQMIEGYGGKCVCCGDSHPEFLTIDHIGGRNPDNHPWSKRAGTGIYAKLKRLGWPRDKYRLLCMNCNFAIRWGETCPHEVERETNTTLPTNGDSAMR